MAERGQIQYGEPAVTERDTGAGVVPSPCIIGPRWARAARHARQVAGELAFTQRLRVQESGDTRTCKVSPEQESWERLHDAASRHDVSPEPCDLPAPNQLLGETPPLFSSREFVPEERRRQQLSCPRKHPVHPVIPVKPEIETRSLDKDEKDRQDGWQTLENMNLRRKLH